MMNYNQLKKFYEKIPKELKFAFAPIFVRVMVNNKVFQTTWKELDEFEKMSLEQQKALQFAKLKETLIYSGEHVPYYKELYTKVGFDPYRIEKAEDITRLPLLEKRQAIDLGERLYSDENIKTYVTYTGGSSGKAMACLLDKDSIYKERAFVCHFLSKLGYDVLKSHTAAFWGHNKDADYYYSPLKNEIVISPFRLFKQDCFENVYDTILKFHTEFIMGYPSAILLFAKLCQKHNKNLKVKSVVFYAENYTVEDKCYIEKTFSCKAVSYYGHTERAVFASVYNDDCIFNDLYGYTELIPTEIENEYRIVCTGFLSRKMPLIRYATDDVIHVLPDGKHQLIGHKKSDVYLIGKNGAHIFKGAMTLHIKELKKIRTYQYVQDEVGKADLDLILDEEITPSEMDSIQQYIDKRCEGLLDVTIKIVDEVKCTSRGKSLWAICNVCDDASIRKGSNK